MGNTRQWEWSTKKEAAAALLAEDSLSIRRIAQQLGTSESTVDRWKKVPEFQTRTRENIAAFRAKVLECGLARKKSRRAALSDKCGASAEMKLVAGGSSGLITSTVSQHMGNTSNWEWSRKKEAAAELLAADSLSIPQIAQQLGTSESTVDRWKKVPEFQARIQENIAAFRTKFLERGLARKESRLAALSHLFRSQKLILAKRGASAEMKSVAGGSSGLITVTWKQVGRGDDMQLIPEYRVDTALSAEIRSTLKQVAREVRKYL